jgi:cytochrome c-type biogenesis protein CcmF
MSGLLFEQAGRRVAKTGESKMEALGQVVTGDGAFWAGQLSHAGIVLIAIGIAFAANLGAHAEVAMSPGDMTSFEGYTITYESPFRQASQSKTIEGSRLTVTRDDQLIGIVEPSWNRLGNSPSVVGTPDVLHRPSGDLYFTLRDLPDETGRVTIAFDTSPMIWVLWLGGLVTVAGGFLAMRARRRERLGAEDRLTSDV